MLSELDARQIRGYTVRDADDREIGRVSEVVVDQRTGSAAFLALESGADGAGARWVPAAGATFVDDHVALSYPGSLVAAAPAPDSGTPPDAARAREILAHYGLQEPVRADDSQDDGVIVRHEERLRAGTNTQVSERAVLRKEVVTEMETIQVPVRRERLVVETVVVDEGEQDELDEQTAALAETAFTGEAYEIVLFAERPVVSTVVVAVERVRVGKEAVTEEQTVTGEVRIEHVDLETDD